MASREAQFNNWLECFFFTMINLITVGFTELSLRAAIPETPEQATVMFWSSLTTLIEQSPHERPIYITRATVEGRKPDVDIEIHVLVTRPPEVASAPFC